MVRPTSGMDGMTDPMPSTTSSTPLPVSAVKAAKGRNGTLLLAGVLAMVAAVWVAYLPTLSAGYIWDDGAFVQNNPHIRDAAGPWHFWKLWGDNRPPDYFPLTSTSLWIEWHWFWGDNPAGYHGVNVGLHAVSSLLLWGVLRRVGLSLSWSWLAAMLFALHPVNVESVAWITQRKNTLPLPLLLGAFWCWMISEASHGTDKSGRRWYAASLVLYTLSLLAKTAGVMLPVAMLAMAWWRRGAVERRDVWRVLPYFVVAAVLGVVTAWYQLQYAIGTEVVRTDGFLSRLLLAGRAVWFYVWKIVWPVNLSFVYPRWPAAEAGRLLDWLPVLGLVGVVVVLWILRSRAWASASLVSLVVYLAMLLPVLGFIDIYFMIHSFVADHWQYFAMPAPLALAVAGVALAVHGRGTVIQIAAWVLLLALAGLLGVMTWKQSRIYHNTETLWRATMAANDLAWLAYVNLAEDLMEAGRQEEAEKLYRKAVEIAPEAAYVHAHLGGYYFTTGNYEKAVISFRRAVELAPLNPPILFNYGGALSEAGLYDEAIDAYTRALKIEPGSGIAYFNRGITYERKGDMPSAAGEYRQALEHGYDTPQLHLNLGRVLLRLKLIDKAIEHFEEALRQRPDDEDARRILEVARQLRNTL